MSIKTVSPETQQGIFFIGQFDGLKKVTFNRDGKADFFHRATVIIRGEDTQIWDFAIPEQQIDAYSKLKRDDFIAVTVMPRFSKGRLFWNAV